VQKNVFEAVKLKNYSPCGVDRLLLEVTVIDGVAAFKLASCEFPSPESCRESENRRFNPRLATPLETFATRELKKLIFQLAHKLFVKSLRPTK
jgi:hypothetical protein